MNPVNGTQQVPLLNCGRCGGPAREETGVSPARMSAPIRFRCQNMHCLCGPYGAEAESAVHGWNRVTQGWIAMAVLVQMSQQIPELEPQIQKAMQGHWDRLAKDKDPAPPTGGPQIEA